MEVQSEIMDTWKRNNQVTLFLLEHIEENWLPTKIQMKGRSIAEQFMHINNIRSYWINKVGEKIDLKIDKKSCKQKALIAKALDRSSDKMHQTLSILFQEHQIKGYKPHPTAFFVQMIAHESHHRGQIMSIISRNDLKIDKTVNFGLWNWNTK